MSSVSLAGSRLSALPRHGDDTTASGGDLSASYCLELHLGDLKQFFNTIDPAPFRERDLDPSAEEFIVGWARELHPEGPLTLEVRVAHPLGDPSQEAMVLADAVHQFFADRALVTRRRLRYLFQRGRLSLTIGLFCLVMSILAGDMLATALRSTRFVGIAREGLLIGGWVAMWRPLEVFLYDWWPIRAEARLFDRLSTMSVRVLHGSPDRDSSLPLREFPNPRR